MALQVLADLTACQGYVCCVMEAPDVFDVDEDTGKVTVLMPEVDDSRRAEVESAVAHCPARALAISGAERS